MKCLKQFEMTWAICLCENYFECLEHAFAFPPLKNGFAEGVHVQNVTSELFQDGYLISEPSFCKEVTAHWQNEIPQAIRGSLKGLIHFCKPHQHHPFFVARSTVSQKKVQKTNSLSKLQKSDTISFLLRR